MWGLVQFPQAQIGGKLPLCWKSQHNYLCVEKRLLQISFLWIDQEVGTVVFVYYLLEHNFLEWNAQFYNLADIEKIQCMWIHYCADYEFKLEIRISLIHLEPAVALGWNSERDYSECVSIEVSCHIFSTHWFQLGRTVTTGGSNRGTES